jgi:hypothetical protein
MPAGSGPQVAVATAVAVSNAEIALVSIPPQSWQENTGLLISWSVYFTDTNAGALTLRIRQGLGVAGANVGPAGGFVQSGIAAAATLVISGQVLDTSPFALATPPGQPQQYTLTALGSVAAIGTGTYCVVELESVAALI